MKHEISDLRKDIEMLRKDLVIKLGGIVIGAVTLIPIVLKPLHLSA